MFLRKIRKRLKLPSLPHCKSNTWVSHWCSLGRKAGEVSTSSSAENEGCFGPAKHHGLNPVKYLKMSIFDPLVVSEDGGGDDTSSGCTGDQ